MLEEKENDGAGGKPQFFALVGTENVMRNLGWEIITMVADDFARSGRFPVIIANDVNVKKITKENYHLFESLMQGYGNALKIAGLVNVTGEVAVMKHSVTAFCDFNVNQQLILNWGASCIGLCHTDKLIDSSEIKPNMPIVGFWEYGYRCNGGTFFTNLILKKIGLDSRGLYFNAEAIKFSEKLTIPSKSYAKLITRVHGWKPDGNITEPLINIAGIAHITGGGIWEKFGEILPEGVGAKLDRMPEAAQILREAQELSWDIPELRLTDLQAYGTFHGGCGMLIICETLRDAEWLIVEAERENIRASIVGETIISDDREIFIQSRFKEGRMLSSKEIKR
jgi:phosphoribosylformylglycinamidine cyclo-ligase